MCSLPYIDEDFSVSFLAALPPLPLLSPLIREITKVMGSRDRHQSREINYRPNISSLRSISSVSNSSINFSISILPALDLIRLVILEKF